MSMANKVAVITGASAGVGEATARQLAAQGATLVLAARTPGPLQALATELGATAVPTDVQQPADCQRLIDTALQQHGGIDLLVNNAGCNHRGEVREVGAEQLAQVIDVNLRAPLILTRLALDSLIERRGAVVNVASLAGRTPLPHEAAYSASKFGLRAFTLALHEELRGSGVRVSVVSPGPIDTGFIMQAIDEVPDTVFSQPMSTADEVAAAILACAADGRPERALPSSGGHLTTLAYLLPGLARRLRPALERKGAKAKARYRARQG